MVTWITGNSQSGKTTLAKQMKTDNTVILDGDDMREALENKDLTKKGRWQQNIRVAYLATILEEQGFDVIVALICPYKKLRDIVHAITNCSFIYLSGGKKHKDYPYEFEEDKFYFRK